MDYYHYLIITVILVTGVWFSVKTKRLTPQASITGAAIGLVLFIAAAYPGIILMTTFFLLGTLATSWKSKYKQQQGLAEINKQGRKASQVMANAGCPAILAVLILMVPKLEPVLIVMIASAFSSATADTLSSELGNVYGRKFYNIISLKKDRRGLDGVISVEGTTIGIAGSAIIAGIHFLFFHDVVSVIIIIISGTLGNFSDSILGALLERKGNLTNDGVNFLNTLFASLVGLVLNLILQ